MNFFSMMHLSTMMLRRGILPTHIRLASLSSSASSPRSSSSPKLSLFLSSSVQSSLRALTGLDYSRVFRVRKTGQELQTPTYAFLTDAQLAERAASVRQKALRKLQMPPVMEARTEQEEILELDEALLGYDQARIVFTDISFGVHDRDRIVVVREPDGKLRKANWTERDRVNQIYFPKEGRKIDIPAMFDRNKLEEILRPDRYEYILDRACVQFEPDHPVFVATCQRVFDHIDEHGHYDVLLSTRHYGPLVFHLVWERRCDDLIVHLLLNKRSLSQAALVTKIFGEVHADSSVAKMLGKDEDDLKLIKTYIEQDSNKATKVKVSLENFLESEEEEQRLRVSHGIEEPRQSLAETLKLD